ncbi:hypothetical protein ACERII_09905 [Evansella sp. AB-rgal1]|uniref:hypothetical protein n=1 Tax=Evansella sp. AB-rgal1 TaxID=3242696 RepID=UPI00359DD3C9
MKIQMVLLLFVLIFLVGCSEEELDGTPRLTGEIVEIEANDKKILVKSSSSADELWLTVTEDTEIDSESEEELGFNNLEEGTSVDIWFYDSIIGNYGGEISHITIRKE